MAIPAIGLCWGTIGKASLTELIEAAARHGFPTISIAPSQYHEAVEAGLDGTPLRRRLADAGVQVRVIDAVSLGLPGMPTEPVVMGGRALPRYDAAACIAVAEAVGAPIINVTHYRGEPTPLEAIAEAVGGMCRLAAKSGVSVALEFVPDGGMKDLASARRIAELSGEPNCAVLLDTWHLARSGGTIADIRDLPPGAIGAFQLADRIEPPPGTPYVPMSGRSLPGEGELPLRETVTAVLANSPKVTIEVEVFSEELAALSIDDAAARTAAAVRAWREAI